MLAQRAPVRLDRLNSLLGHKQFRDSLRLQQAGLEIRLGLWQEGCSRVPRRAGRLQHPGNRFASTPRCEVPKIGRIPPRQQRKQRFSRVWVGRVMPVQPPRRTGETLEVWQMLKCSVPVSQLGWKGLKHNNQQIAAAIARKPRGSLGRTRDIAHPLPLRDQSGGIGLPVFGGRPTIQLQKLSQRQPGKRAMKVRWRGAMPQAHGQNARQAGRYPVPQSLFQPRGNSTKPSHQLRRRRQQHQTRQPRHAFPSQVSFNVVRVSGSPPNGIEPLLQRLEFADVPIPNHLDREKANHQPRTTEGDRQSITRWQPPQHHQQNGRNQHPQQQHVAEEEATMFSR